MSFTLLEDSNCIDVGAHTGDILRDFVRLAPKGIHMAFEPLPHLASELERQFPGVDVSSNALAAEAGMAQFVFVKSSPAYSGLKVRSYPNPHETLETIEVQTVRLDDVIPSGYVPHFIKVDVEGGELGVFQGAVQTLRRHRPIVWFEHGIGGADWYGTTSEDVYDLLVADVQLRIFDADGNGPLSKGDFCGLFDKPIWNFLARP